MRRLLKTVLNRTAEPAAPIETVFRAEEVGRWPESAIDILCDARIIRELAPQDSITCRGCEERCWRPIEIIDSGPSGPRRISTCPIRDGFGPFDYTPRVLRRYAARRSDIAVFIARDLGLAVRDRDPNWRVVKLGTLRYGDTKRLVSISFYNVVVLRVGTSDVPLAELLAWDGRLTIDRSQLHAHLSQSDDYQSGGKRAQPSTTVRQQKVLTNQLRDRRLQMTLSRLAREHPHLNKHQLAERLVREKLNEGVKAARIERITRLPKDRPRK